MWHDLDSRDSVSPDQWKKQKIRNKKGYEFFEGFCKKEIGRLPESPKTQKNLLEFHLQELATLATADAINVAWAVSIAELETQDL